MSMNVGGGADGVKSDINVTPLVDVMLVLLIIMMLVAPLLQQGVALTLPKAANSVSKPETQEQTVLAITPDKRLFLNAIEVPKNALGQRVSDLLASKTEKVVIIRADKDVEYSAVMDAMDKLRASGVENMGLITESTASSIESGGGQ